MSKILLTGKNGQVGACLAAQLAKLPEWETLALGSAELDIRDRAAVFQAAAAFRPDIIINAAAYTAVDKAESDADTAFAVNRDGTAHLAQAAEQCGAAFLHISTDYVFDGKGNQSYTETAPTAPQNVYGASKLSGEQAALAACARTIVLRTAWVFGAHGGNFVKTMLRLGRDRNRLGIVADQFGAPTAAADIAAALLAIAAHIAAGKETAYGIYHFSGSPYVSWFEFAGQIFAQAAAQGLLARIPQLDRLNTADYPTPAVRPANSRLDCSKIQAAFGIAPSDWQAHLRDLRDYLPQ